ncbi:MAG TPA: hypothetical protein VH157_09445 [Bryobacteraceae bacterium]|jgi:hypothetical protein|nr:hypothetical protein [Bryobacteraceae bacterium]
MKLTQLAALAAAAVFVLHAETSQERGKRVVNECLDALGGDRYLKMENREEAGRAYSFYREQLSGLSIAKIYTRYYPVPDPAHELAVRERENFGKKEDFGVLFTDKEAWDVTYRGARPIEADRFTRYKETTLRDIFYILRVRFHEKGLIFESRGSDVIENSPVEIVDITDADNRTTTVYFHQITKLPVRQVFFRRNEVTRDRDEEVTRYSKYRDAGGVQWPFAIERDRNGEKIYEIFSESVKVDNPKEPESLYSLPSTIKLLKQP